METIKYGMKKFIVMLFLTLFACFSALAFSGCEKSADLSPYVSQNRMQIYGGKSENFDLTLYAERREEPFIGDGYVGEMKNVLIIKLDGVGGDVASADVTVVYDNEEKVFAYDKGVRNSNVSAVEKLPQSPTVTAKITRGDKSETIELYSKKLSTDCTYIEAIDAVQKYDGETVERLFYGNRALAEINVRLISDDGKNYYFVGFIEEGGKTSAYLIDAETATVIATRTVGK